MAKDITKGSGIFSQLQVDVDQRKKLDELEEKRMELEEVNREELSRYEESIDGILEGNRDVSDLSRIDQGIERGRAFKGEISDLAESLTGELHDLGQFFGDMSQYKGIVEQSLAKVGLSRWADKRRLSRVKQSDVKENLQTILDYGHHMVGKLYTAILENAECHARIGATIDKTAAKLKENQPHYETWRSSREALERKLEDINDRLDQASESEYGAIEEEKNTVSRELHEAQVNENNYFTIVDKARKALPVQRTHHEAYKDLMDSLTQFRTGLEEDINHVTEVYQSAPVAIQTALKTKAASQYDKGMKYATDVATDTVLKSVRGVLDETASRAERPLIEDEKLQAYREAAHEARSQFDTQISKLKEKYSASAAVN